MMLAEYKELSDNMRTFWKVRLTILGFVMTLMGILINQLKSLELHKIIILEASLLLLIIGAAVIIISITRHLVIYAIRLEEIEKYFMIKGFWQKWGTFIKSHPRCSNTKSISLVIHLINIVVLIFIFWNNTTFILDLNITAMISTSILVIFAMFNLFYIKKHLNPGKHWTKLKLHWKNL